MPNLSAPHPAAPVRILLVNDNKNGLLARKIMLEEQGYQVTAVKKAEEALAMFESAVFEIVVTDYRMPHMNGVELLRKLREIRENSAVVLMSGVAEVLGLTEANTGADAVVPKNLHEVQNMLRAVNRLATRLMPRKPATSQAHRRVRKALKA